jgi:phage tail protein X
MILYKTNQGDRWDLIAYRFYGNSTRVKPILEANASSLWLLIKANAPVVLSQKDLTEENSIDGLKQNVDKKKNLPSVDRIRYAGLLPVLPGGITLIIPEMDDNEEGEVEDSETLPPWKQ